MRRLFSFGPFRLDAQSRVLLHNNELVTLPCKAIEVLLALVKNHGQVVSKNDLMEAVWPDAFVEEGNLTQQIHLLRRALDDKAEEHRYILTVPGRGYSFVATVQEIEEQVSERLRDQARSLSDLQDDLARGKKGPPHTVWDSIVHQKRGLLLSVVFAIAALAVLIEMFTPTARYFNNRGIDLQGRGELHSAIAEYRRALLLRPSYAEARYNLADAYEEIPDYDKALSEYQRAIDTDPVFYQAYNNLSRLYILRRRDYGAALRLLDRALSFNPKEPSVRYSLYKNYGWADFELHNFEQAEAKLKSAIGLDADRGAAHCLLAKVADAQGKRAMALNEWAFCVAYSSQHDVEPEWRNEGQERLIKEEAK